ncbi:MAG: SufD family Fe-S cluster assembly protein [Lachnospiraceae bacterium]|nr:SufD family Fe-S cluster assembly protein [Lachnospiraceae bacterium]
MAAELNAIQKTLLENIADLHEVPTGAYNIRSNGGMLGRNTTANIDIVTKEDKPGIDIIIKPGTKNQSVHIPVIITQTGLKEMVYNEFFIGEDCDVVIVAGCGIHNAGDEGSEHSGIHTFHVGKNSRVKYVEKHYGMGEGTGERVMNPSTEIYLEEGSHLEMETIQIEGINSTERKTYARVEDGASIVIKEKIMTHDRQTALTDFKAELVGKDSSADICSRSVAKNQSKQTFRSNIIGSNACKGHSECDAIIMDEAVVEAIPELTAANIDASLIHEAAIGKIAGEQLTKLMTLGLTESEAETQIINGFLK